MNLSALESNSFNDAVIESELDNVHMSSMQKSVIQ
jgi:hypothetical protein